MKHCILWGGTGQAKVLHEALSRQGHVILVIIDNRNIPSPFSDIPIVYGVDGFYKWLESNKNFQLYGLAAIGGYSGQSRLEIMELFQSNGIHNFTIIHDKSFVAKDAFIDEGSQILALSAVCTHCHIGKGVIINTAACVDHDCIIGNGVHIAPGAKLAGEITIEDYVFIGTGAIILPGICIGQGARIGAGAVVTKNVPAGAVMIGNPARMYNENK